ncbi:hypothetical protein C0995_004076 [Termitomyces sp. Mi166|nr:hypothetical protein C0995_004076 [Termitomyces sp. Mi166\
MSAPYGTQQPIVQQPIASQGMVINPKNSLNKPDIDGQGREWRRLSYLERNGTPDPERGGVCNSDCFIYGCLLACCNAGCILEINNRAHVRGRYGIKGGGCNDCFTSWCCTACALTQEEAEIGLEEGALAQQQGGFQKS